MQKDKLRFRIISLEIDTSSAFFFKLPLTVDLGLMYLGNDVLFVTQKFVDFLYIAWKSFDLSFISRLFCDLTSERTYLAIPGKEDE